MNQRARNFTGKVVTEAKLTTLVFVYLAALLVAMTTYRRLLATDEPTTYVNYGYSVLEALVLAKLIVLGHALRIGERFQHRPLIIPTIYRALCFCPFLLASSFLEHALTDLWRRQSPLRSAGWHSSRVFCIVLLSGARAMRTRLTSKTVSGLLLCLSALAVARPAAALNADYWRGGWRTPLGGEPHLYEFIIRGRTVTGVYCRSCSDATTIGFIDGTWDEHAGIDFTVTFANGDGSIKSVDKQHAMLSDGRMIVTGARRTALTLVKDPRGADPGGAPAYHLPPGTPPALPAPRPAGAVAGGGGGRRGAPPPYWQAGPFTPLRPADIVGSWIGPFGLGMNRQIFTFLLVGNRLRGVVCGRCDNPYTLAAIDHVEIVGDTLYFDIEHQDWGESDPPTFARNIGAQLVQNEMLAFIVGKNLAIDPAHPPARPPGRGFTLLGPIAPAATKGNTSEGVDVWGPGTGSGLQPPPGRTPIAPVNPGR